jgi:hypothetical protein
MNELTTNDVLTADWIVEEFSREGYSGRMAEPTTPNALALMDTFLRKHGMKVSNLNNKSRWERIVRHTVPTEQHLADPAHYHRLPARFVTRMDFLKHHFATLFAFFHNPRMQFILAAASMTVAHDMSYQMYAKPLPWLGSTISCSKVPVQFHCGFLKQVQDYTYSGYQDLAKFAATFVTQSIIAYLASALVPLKKVKS